MINPSGSTAVAYGISGDCQDDSAERQRQHRSAADVIGVRAGGQPRVAGPRFFQPWILACAGLGNARHACRRYDPAPPVASSTVIRVRMKYYGCAVSYGCA